MTRLSEVNGARPTWVPYWHRDCPTSSVAVPWVVSSRGQSLWPGTCPRKATLFCCRCRSQPIGDSYASGRAPAIGVTCCPALTCAAVLGTQGQLQTEERLHRISANSSICKIAPVTKQVKWRPALLQERVHHPCTHVHTDIKGARCWRIPPPPSATHNSRITVSQPQSGYVPWRNQ